MQTLIARGLTILLSFGCALSFGYPVGPPLSLARLATNANVIFKGVAISTQPVEDGSFKAHPGFAVHETRFKIVSLIQGKGLNETVAFRYYAQSTNEVARMFAPQYYDFHLGEAYLVFAKKHEATGAFRQVLDSHTTKGDEGALRCVNPKHVEGQNLSEIFWHELMQLLTSTKTNDLLYAIRQLKEMSQIPPGDFGRAEALKAIYPFINHSQADVAGAAIMVLGSDNPYLTEERALFWLTTIGSGEIPGLGQMDPKMRNVGGELYTAELIALAESKAEPVLRALAIRALGLVRKPLIERNTRRWVAAPESPVRASASLLLADYPGRETMTLLRNLSADAAPEVRAATAYAVGFSQQGELADLLGVLLKDPQPQVRVSAAMSLLSFSPTNEAIARVMRANISNVEFHPLFLNALGKSDPSRYLDELAQAIEQKASPENWPGGEIPAFTAWKILFKYLQKQPQHIIQEGKMDRYLNALEQVGNYSSSEPRDIYAFYLQRDMPERAKAYRKRATSAATYDLEYFFRQVDQNPALYRRE